MSSLKVVLDDVLAPASSAGPVVRLVLNEPFNQNTTEERLVVRGARVVMTAHRSSRSVFLQRRVRVLNRHVRFVRVVVCHAVVLSRREDPHR